MLGHESITTTEIYTHLDRAFLESLQKFHQRFTLGLTQSTSETNYQPSTAINQ
jgi:hypothetical protein